MGYLMDFPMEIFYTMLQDRGLATDNLLFL